MSAASCAEGTTPQLSVPSQACLLALLCQWEHMSVGPTNTSVSRPQSPHQSDHSALHRPGSTPAACWGGEGGREASCAGNLESEKDEARE